MGQELDPRTTELPADFFDRQEIEDENTFKEQFTTPAMQKGMAEVQQKKPEQERDDIDDEGKGDELDFEKKMAEQEAKELADFNERYGQNFQSMKELRESIKRKEQQPVVDELQKKVKDMRVYEEFLNPDVYDDKKLVMEEEILKAEKAQKNLNDPDVMEEIKEKVLQMEANNVLGYAAESIRNSLRSTYNGIKAEVDGMKQKLAQTEQEREQNFKESVQSAVESFHKQGEFGGVKITKEDLFDVYQKVMKNKNVEHVSQNPAEAVEFELYKRYKDVILKNAGKPDYSEGVRSALEEVGMSSTGSGSQNGGHSKQDTVDEEDWIAKFIK